MKQVVFNVGGALSTYIEFGERKVLVDIGSSDDFNPIIDFLYPLYVARNSTKNADGKFVLDQCIISHPHKDHIAAITDFDKYFFPQLLTCPNSNDGLEEQCKVNWDLIGNEEDDSIKTLKRMLKGRTPPLRSSDTASLFIYYIRPKIVEQNSTLSSESYVNNISIATIIRNEGYSVLMPGDLQKAGMEYLIKDSGAFRRKLKDGIDVLVTPHHGLRSSFSTKLFDEMNGKKTRCLNVVPEKPNTDDDREVDSRYSDGNYCAGENSLSTQDESHYQVRTSRGHVLLDYSQPGRVLTKITNAAKDVIGFFS